MGEGGAGRFRQGNRGGRCRSLGQMDDIPGEQASSAVTAELAQGEGGFASEISRDVDAARDEQRGAPPPPLSQLRGGGRSTGGGEPPSLERPSGRAPRKRRVATLKGSSIGVLRPRPASGSRPIYLFVRDTPFKISKRARYWYAPQAPVSVIQLYSRSSSAPPICDGRRTEVSKTSARADARSCANGGDRPYARTRVAAAAAAAHIGSSSCTFPSSACACAIALRGLSHEGGPKH